MARKAKLLITHTTYDTLLKIQITTDAAFIVDVYYKKYKRKKTFKIYYLCDVYFIDIMLIFNSTFVINAVYYKIQVLRKT